MKEVMCVCWCAMYARVIKQKNEEYERRVIEVQTDDTLKIDFRLGKNIYISIIYMYNNVVNVSGNRMEIIKENRLWIFY